MSSLKPISLSTLPFVSLMTILNLLQKANRKMNKKTMIIGAGVASAAVVAVVAATFIFKKKSKTSDNTIQGIADFGSGNSSLTINKAGTAGTITLEKGFEIDLINGVIPATSTFPQNAIPAKNVAHILADDEYSTSAGVPNGADGATWVLRYYLPSTPGEAVPLYLHYSPANDDGTRTSAHFYSAPADGKLTLLKTVNMDFQIGAL